MMKRLVSLAAAAAVAVFVTAAFASAAKAADSTVVGTITKVSAADSTITVTDKNGKDHALTIAKDAKVTCDGKDCKLADLDPTKVKMVTVTLDATIKTQANSIDAATK